MSSATKSSSSGLPRCATRRDVTAVSQYRLCLHDEGPITLFQQQVLRNPSGRSRSFESATNAAPTSSVFRLAATAPPALSSSMAWQFFIRHETPPVSRHLRDDVAQRCLARPELGRRPSLCEGGPRGFRPRSRSAQNPLHVPNFSRRGHPGAGRAVASAALAAGSASSNGYAAAQERRRRERGAGLPAAVSRALLLPT